MWETTLFENMPVIAAVTILTKIQSDVRYAESEALHTLINNIDEGDVRVNQLNAFVIPNSKNIMRGGKYSANIVLAAIDTTQRPAIYINGKQLLPKTTVYMNSSVEAPAYSIFKAISKFRAATAP